jgi:hypothetical protein
MALCGGRSPELKEAIERETKDLRDGEKRSLRKIATYW